MSTRLTLDVFDLISLVMNDQVPADGSGHDRLKGVAEALREAAHAIDVVAKGHELVSIVDDSVRRSNPTSVGERIRIARKAARLSASVLALRLGVSLKTLYRFEGNETEPDVGVLVAICRECRVTADWLLFGRGDGPTTIATGNGSEG